MSRNNRARRKEILQARKRRFKQLQQHQQQSFEGWSGPVGFFRDSDRKVQGHATSVLSSLEKRHRKHPHHTAVLLELIEEHRKQGNAQAACVYAERLVQLKPDAPEWRLALAEAYLQCAAVHAACQETRTVGARWPDHPLVREFAPTADKLERGCRESAAKFDLGDRDAVEELAMHDRSMIYVAAGEYDLAINVGQELVRRLPEFVRAWNNLSLAYFQAGHSRDAAESVQQSLKLDPSNVHALSNLTRILFLEGKADQAQRAFDQLIAVPDVEPDYLIKKAEAAAWMGQDQVVVDACRAYEETGDQSDPTSEALLYHFRAVAEYRLGHEANARQWWSRSLSLQPQFELASTNLAAWTKLKLEFSPWYFDFPYWIRKDQLSTWLGEWKRLTKEGPAAWNYFLASHPELQSLVPGLLDRGDESAIGLALAIATDSGATAFHECLKQFATGKRGPAEQRMKAANHLARAGVVPAGRQFRFFSGGEWKDVLLFSWEITEEPTPPPKRSEEVHQLCAEAYECLQDEDWPQAERLLRRAVKLEPNAPDVWNNLAAALEFCGDDREVHEITQYLRSHFPTYFFGIIREASQAIDNDDFEHAHELIDGLSQRKGLHITEFRSLASLQIKLAMSRDELEAAESWLEPDPKNWTTC